MQSALPAIIYAVPKIFGIFIGGLIVLVVGFLDDKFNWTPLRKLLGQIFAALILMHLGFSISLFEGWGFFGYLVTFVWILLIINAFNLINSLDGHCAGIALIACGMLLWLTHKIRQYLTGQMQDA